MTHATPVGANVITFTCNYIYPHYISQFPLHLPDFDSRDLDNGCLYFVNKVTQQWVISAIRIPDTYFNRTKCKLVSNYCGHLSILNDPC